MDFTPTNHPFITGEVSDDVPSVVGGRVVRLKAAAALKLGDTVYVSAADTVNKSATVANHSARVGIVVGGDLTGGRVITDSAEYDSFVACSASNGYVLIQVDGIAYAIADAALAVGKRVVPSTTTAGRVKIGADLTVDSGATAVTSSAANGDIISGDGSNTLMGVSLTAATDAGDIIKILLQL